MTLSEALPAAAAHVFEAMRRARFAQVLAKRGEGDSASEAAKVAAEETARALRLMEGAGIVPPRFPQTRRDPLEPLPLDSPLAPLAQTLLSTLKDAEKAAGILDRERGDVDADGRPEGWGERIAVLRLSLELEMFDPSERVTGGRE